MTVKIFTSILFSSLFIISCSSPEANKDSVEQNKTASDGKELLEKNCLTCHGNGTSHDDILAPPMKGVKRHYMNKNISEDEFVASIITWVENPSEDKSKMPGALNRFGIMPKQNISKEDLKTIAQYIFNNTMPKPVWFDSHVKENH